MNRHLYTKTNSLSIKRFCLFSTVVFIFSIIFTPLQTVFAERMSSGNYTLQSDSLNFEGTRSTSGSYVVEDTGGESATGYSNSANEYIHAGFQQTSTSTSSTTSTTTTTDTSTNTSTGHSGSVPPPVNVVNFIAIPLDKSIGLSWVYPDGVEISGVRIVRSDKFFPNDISDGEVIFEGNLKAIVDTDVVIGTRYYYALFTKNSKGEYSSGVLSQARIAPKGDTTVPITPSDIFKNIPPSLSIDKTISSLSIADFDFIQNDRKILERNGMIPVDGKANLTIRLDYKKVPEILKTIAVTLTDPEDSTRMFTFLLRVNKDKTSYEATIAPLGKSGDYKLDITILDYKNQGLKRLSGSLKALALEEGQNFFGLNGKDSSRLNLMFVLLVIAFIAIVTLAVLEKKKREKRTQENNTTQQ